MAGGRSGVYYAATPREVAFLRATARANDMTVSGMIRAAMNLFFLDNEITVPKGMFEARYRSLDRLVPYVSGGEHRLDPLRCGYRDVRSLRHAIYMTAKRTGTRITTRQDRDMLVVVQVLEGDN